MAWLRNIFARNDAPPATRSLDAAAGGRRWRDDRRDSSPASAFHAGASIIAARAAHYVSNTPEGSRIRDSLVSNLIGPGITPRPQQPSQAVRGLLASGFLAWTDAAEASGRTDYYGVQAALTADMVVLGEGLAVIVADRATGAPQIRRLHPEQLDRSKILQMTSGGRIVQGVETDADGRIAAYWVRPSAPGEQLGGVALTSERIPSSQILHVFRQLWPGQVRGVSWFAPALMTGRDLDSLLDAMLVRQKVAAMFVGSIRDQDGSAGGFEGDQTGTSLDTTAEPGTLRIEQPGMETVWSDPPDAGDSVSFSKAMQRRLAIATGATYSQASGDFSEANYSSERAAQLEFRRFAEGIQHHVIIPAICKPVWDHFIRWQVLTGGISASAYQAQRAAFHSVKWLPPAWPWVDPQKDAQATILEMDNLLRSRSEAVAERGFDIEALDQEIAADRARAERLGITPVTQTPQQGSGNAN